MTDISIAVGEFKFNYRVGAIIQDGDHFLLNRLPGRDFWFLPGGRVAAGESAQLALRREIKEELGIEVFIGKMLIAAENFFTFEGTQFHEICFFFEVNGIAQNSKFELDNASDGLHKDDLKWVSKADLDRVNLKPAVLVDLLRSGDPTFQHVIIDK